MVRSSRDELADILQGGKLRTVFQPIVELDSRTIVAYEALTRGPVGSPLETPDALFAAARASGRLAELDSACRVEAFRAAFAAGLDTPRGLFVNSEPEALSLLADDVRPTTPAMVLEITERLLTSDPAQLLRSIDHVRELGWTVALDDVGADSASIALLPLLKPEIIKLDLRIVREMPNQNVAQIMTAITAYAESSGSIIVAEGIENERHLQSALAMGATLGQGWLFGRPVVLPDPLPAIPGLPSPVERSDDPLDVTPYTIAAAERTPRTYSRDLLAEISVHLESRALAAGDTAVVLSSFQRASDFSRHVQERYRELSEHVALAGALAPGLAPDPLSGRLRVAPVGAEDALLDEWSVVVVSPEFTALLAARTRAGAPGADDDEEPQFEFVLTHDRAIAVAAARSLMARL